MHLCIRGIDFASFYDFDIWFWNCSDSVIFLASFYYIGVFGWYKFSGYYLCFGLTQCVKREKKRQNINFPILRALCRYRMGMSSAIFHLSVDITANCEFYFCPCWRVLDAIVRNKRIFIDNLFLFLTPNWQHWGHKTQDGDK